MQDILSYFMSLKLRKSKVLLMQHIFNVGADEVLLFRCILKVSTSMNEPMASSVSVLDYI